MEPAQVLPKPKVRSKQYNYIHHMAKNCPPDVRDNFINKYMEPLMAADDLWKEIIIADPASSMKFISNLVELFDTENIETLSKNLIHFRIAVATAAVFSEPQMLRRNQFGFGTPKVPDPKMIQRFRSVKNSYDKDHYHEMFRDFSSWHMQFIVNTWWEDSDLEYIRKKYPKADLNWAKLARYYIKYTLKVCY